MRRLVMLCLTTVLLLAACRADFFGAITGAVKPPAVTFVLSADTTDSDALDTAVGVLQRRVASYPVPAEVTRSGGFDITVAIAMYDGTLEDISALLTRPGRVEFVDMRNAPPELTADPNDALIATSAHPTDGEHLDPVTGAPYETIIDAVQVLDAQAAASQFTNTWDITIKLSPEHGTLMSDYTAANIGTTLGILIDGRLLSAPIIQAQVGDEALIAGNFTEAEARELAAVIGGGTLPLALTVAEMR